MKRSKKVKFESKLSTIEKKLWKLCREIVFKRDADKNGNVHCYTCGARNLIGQNCQLGHAYPNGALGASMSHDIRILRFQCARCNVFFGGMQAVFWKNLENEIGKENANLLYEECRKSKGSLIKAREHYLKLIETYKKP